MEAEITKSSHERHGDVERPTVRASAVLVTGDGLLLVRQQRAASSYWLLPGGGVDFGESLHEALARELAEELGLEIVVGRPLALVEAISPDMGAYRKHVVHVLIEATLADAAATPTVGGDAAVLEARYFARAELASLTIRPPVADFLDEYFDGAPSGVTYLGRRW